MFTPCDKCCFIDDGRCSLGQLCAQTKSGSLVAPGYCRWYRTQRWAEQQKRPAAQTVEDSLSPVDLRSCLTRIILFDSVNQSQRDLQKTLGCLRGYRNKSIIADYSGQNGETEAFKYWRDCSDPLLALDVSQVRENDLAEVVDRVSKSVDSTYFSVELAGQRISNLVPFMYEHVLRCNERCVMWLFPSMVGKNLVFNTNAICGLYITTAFRQMGGNRGPEETKLFLHKARELEVNVGINLVAQQRRAVIVP